MTPDASLPRFYADLAMIVKREVLAHEAVTIQYLRYETGLSSADLEPILADLESAGRIERSGSIVRKI